MVDCTGRSAEATLARLRDITRAEDPESEQWFDRNNKRPDRNKDDQDWEDFNKSAGQVLRVLGFLQLDVLESIFNIIFKVGVTFFADEPLKKHSARLFWILPNIFFQVFC